MNQNQPPIRLIRLLARYAMSIVGILGVLLFPVLAGAEDNLAAVYTNSKGPILDANAEFWHEANAVKVAMYPQMVTTPTKPEAAITSLTVKAAHNDQWLAILIEWPDATRNDLLVVDQFGDQVAVEFPIDANPNALPSPMMGNPGGRVNILQWRAALQRDIDQGELKIQDLYPNAVFDIYPDQVLRATDSRPYSGALGVDNPVSRAHQSPVLDQMAEGWGTLTTKPDQHADGKGIWENGTWRVIITTSLSTADTNSLHLSAGQFTNVAFAVWEGGNKEVGSRKAWSAWVPFTLE
ncbi:EB_dh domain-containing protein [Gammaproteobacteria bacterium]